jgi:beta-lactamase superfamily II metal-dependent hydrolase
VNGARTSFDSFVFAFMRSILIGWGRVSRAMAFGCLLLWQSVVGAELLKVKPNREAIIKSSPTGNAPEVARLGSGTTVEKVGDTDRYHSIRTAAGVVGWSYKGNFEAVPGVAISAPALTKEFLLARTDVFKIVILDVEVGDATLFICPLEDGRQDVILIDTGVNDSDRIREELSNLGFSLTGKPITRFIVSHYDTDHIGHARQIVPLAQVVYDHGDNNIDGWYRTLVSAPGVDRQPMRLSYNEQFTGGVRFECVAVNQATDFSPMTASSNGDDNPNSIALVISYGDFDYFTAGDLTLVPERALATGIKDCDVYHVDHHGSRTTSSDPSFLARLHPEVSIASNGTMHGHPNKEIGERLTALGSKFFQTNVNPDRRAYHPDPKFVADDTFLSSDAENAEGAKGTIRIVVDPPVGKYYVIMDGLPLEEGTFSIEH